MPTLPFSDHATVPPQRPSRSRRASAEVGSPQSAGRGEPHAALDGARGSARTFACSFACAFAGALAWAPGLAAAQPNPTSSTPPAVTVPATPPDTVPAPQSGESGASAPAGRPTDAGTGGSASGSTSPAEPAAPSPAPAPAQAPTPDQAPAVQAPVDAPVPPADPRVVFRVTLPDGRLVLVAEGDQEPRSVGSYTVRLYGGGPAATATDRFIAGLVHPRDGGVERVVIEDLDRDGRADLVVVMRAAGSGGYLSADAYSFASNRMARRASIGSVPPDADIVRMIAPRVKRATAP